jgi:adenine-specific DNA-methyltransferase
MRYIGNKTRLLPFIHSALRRLEIEPGSAHDAFAGTASVGRALKAAGWRVASSDIMTYSYVFARAYVVAQQVPGVRDLRAGDADFRQALRSASFRRRAEARTEAGLAGGVGALAAVAEYLTSWLEPERGFIADHFGPAGGRMYYTAENAERIDAVRRHLHHWRSAGLIGDDAFYVLLAALLEAADRVANTAGVYAAYIKQWQPNALRSLVIAPEIPRRGPRGSTAHCADAAAVARSLGPVDLLYVDPPYNARQYMGYYHLPEIIARGWFDQRPIIRGKTGLLDGDTQRSAWCSPQRAQLALAELLAATGARHVLVSYNSEGLLPEATLRAALADAAIDGHVRRFTRHYRRYRADRDRAGRRYRGDRVRELLYYVRLR